MKGIRLASQKARLASQIARMQKALKGAETLMSMQTALTGAGAGYKLFADDPCEPFEWTDGLALADSALWLGGLARAGHFYQKVRQMERLPGKLNKPLKSVEGFNSVKEYDEFTRRTLVRATDEALQELDWNKYVKYTEYFDKAVQEGKLTPQQARQLKKALADDIRPGRGGVSDGWYSPEEYIESMEEQKQTKDLFESGAETPEVEYPELKLDPSPDNPNTPLGDVGDMKLDLPDLDTGDLDLGDLPDLDLPPDLQSP